MQVSLAFSFVLKLIPYRVSVICDEQKVLEYEEGTITAFIVIPKIIKGISTNCVMGLLHLNFHKCRSRPVPQTGNDHNVIISHNTLVGKKKKNSLQSSSSNNIRLKLNRQLMEQLCYLRLVRDLVLSASLAVPLTLFTLVRTKILLPVQSVYTEQCAFCYRLLYCLPYKKAGSC